MAKPELGTKRLCPGCGAKYYDLNKDPIVCPKCGTLFAVAAPPPPRAVKAAAVVEKAQPEVEEEETGDVELVSLEEADEEAQPASRDTPADEEDVELDADLPDDDDDAFLEDDEEDDGEVSDVVRGDVEDDDENT